MAAFVVISTDNRLSGLVDGIERCLPLNPSIGTYISTGKIEKEGENFRYTYQTSSESRNHKEEKGVFADIFINQLAEFRRTSEVKDTLKVFMLENPRTEEEIQTLDYWMRCLDELFTSDAARKDDDIYIYRVLLTYDVEKPDDVARQLPPDFIKNYLERREEFAFKDSSSILCISNRDNDCAAIFSNKEEHDLKMPRLLADFMMLLSSNSSQYVFKAVCSEERCFSLGYAESMYYFPDVRKFCEHADRCSLYAHILNAPDETAALDNDKEAMDIEKHPVGLNERKDRITKKYTNVPFDRDIKLRKDSADFIIEGCLQKLKPLYCKKREEEIETKEAEVKEKIEELEAEYNSMSQEDWESEDEFKARKKEKCGEKKNKVKEFRDELNRFRKEFPEFICREEICVYLGRYDDKKEREDYLKRAEEQYNKLVTYSKGPDFFDYVREHDRSCNNLQDNLGCKHKFWRRKSQKTPTPTLAHVSSPMLGNVMEIRKQWDLKRDYVHFLGNRCEIEQAMKSEEEWCKKFKLTDHWHHYYHLIDLLKLKDYQKRNFDDRFEQILTQWNNDKDNRNLTQLKDLLHRNTDDYTDKLKYIDWRNPFPFVSDTSDSKLAEVCDKLYKKSSPFVHYQKVTATEQNPITSALYSDIPDIENRFKDFKDNVANGSGIWTYHSTHIASKLCLFQFMPLDEASLRNLCELI